MKFGFENSYLFPSGNKNGLVFNEPDMFFTEDCSILLKFKPDVEAYLSNIDEDKRYHGCIVGKNGKHIGIFYLIFLDENDIAHHSVVFEYWEKKNDSEEEDIKILAIPVPPPTHDQYFNVSLIRKDNTFTLTVDGQSKSDTVGELSDYSYSFLWLGAATRINEDHNNVFIGEIDQMHIQNGACTKEEVDSFFNDYYNFLPTVTVDKKNTTLFTSDFRNTTLYKIFDQSNNGNHPILYSKIWLD